MAEVDQPGILRDDPSKPNYAKEKSVCRDFIENFFYMTVERKDQDGKVTAPKAVFRYRDYIDGVRLRSRHRFDIELDDVFLFAGAGDEFVRKIINNTKRYEELFSQVIDEMVRPGDPVPANVPLDNADVVMQHRIRQGQVAAERAGEANVDPNDIAAQYTARMVRRYEVRFVPRTTDKAVAVRDIKAQHLGKLVQVRAIVLRASDVKPLIQVASYACDTCGYEMNQDVNGRSFMPLQRCTSEQCTKNNNDPGAVYMMMRACRFTKYQEIRVQELPEDVPVGNIPRAMTIIARGESTRCVVPGDQVILGGVYLPTPFTGYQAIRAGLTADTYLEAHSIIKSKKVENGSIDTATEEKIEQILDADPYTTLSQSIAPEIFGHEDVKKALLLQLIGGISLTQKDGMRTRGDINICLMGDPGVAKSQMLKYITRTAPRAVYTTGKGSSGVGLTAAVVRDPITQELTLEGGALVLADMGICAIDEFDKMEESDRTAIHEVMEQQTVSIAKAGITTTLNARTAILAAANPRYGRYNRTADKDPHVALEKNINLPASLLSRFDLLFLMLDEVDTEADRALANHITYVHQHQEHPPLAFEPVPTALIRQYISVAKWVKPHVPASLASYISELYVDMRNKDYAKSAASGGRGTITARQLLSILRLAGALAKLHLRMDVNTKDVDEAVRLINISKASVAETGEGSSKRPADAVSAIYALLQDAAGRNGGTVSMEDARQSVQRGGYSEEALEECLAQYSAINVLQVNATMTRIDFVM